MGDNVGDIAGMGADLFGSFAESTCAALVVSAVSSLGRSHDWPGGIWGASLWGQKGARRLRGARAASEARGGPGRPAAHLRGEAVVSGATAGAFPRSGSGGVAALVYIMCRYAHPRPCRLLFCFTLDSYRQA